MPERVCKTCVNQVLWGCDAVETDQEDPQYGGKVWLGGSLMPLEIDGEMVWRCPRRPLKDAPEYWSRLLFFFSHFQEGHLPDDGAISSQSHKAMIMFGVIQDVLAEVEKDKAERAAARRNRGG